MSKPPGQVPAQPRANAWIALVVGCHGVFVLQSDGTEQLCMTSGRRPGWDVEYILHAVDTSVTSSHSGTAVSSPNVLYQNKLKQRRNKKNISLPCKYFLSRSTVFPPCHQFQSPAFDILDPLLHPTITQLYISE